MEYPFGNNFHYQSGNQGYQNVNSDSLEQRSTTDQSQSNVKGNLEAKSMQPSNQNYTSEAAYQNPYYVNVQSPYYNVQMVGQQRPPVKYVESGSGHLLQDQMVRTASQNLVENRGQPLSGFQEIEIKNQAPENSTYMMEKVRQVVHPPPDLTEKLRMVVYQMNQLKAQIMSIQASNSPQTKELITPLACKMQYLQHIYTQLGSYQVPTHQIPNAAHVVNAPFNQMQHQGNMQMYQQQNMHYMQQRYIQQQQSMARQNYADNPNVVAEKSTRVENNDRYGQKPAGTGHHMQHNLSQNAPKKRRRKSNSDYETYSSSPEETGRDYEYVGATSGPIRRSTRTRKVKNYVNEYDNDETFEQEESGSRSVDASKLKLEDLPKPEILAPQTNSMDEGGGVLIEKILGDRLIDGSCVDSSVPISEDNLEYFVKYKAYSYLHCEWLSKFQMKMRDRLAFNKIKRYHSKKDSTWRFNMDEEYFNPDYVEIDRIIAVTKSFIPASQAVPLVEKCSVDDVKKPLIKEEEMKEVIYENVGVSDELNTSLAYESILHTDVKPELEDEADHNLSVGMQTIKSDESSIKQEEMVDATFYLVKWCSLPYEDCTWEYEANLDPDSIKDYWEREKRLINEKRIFVQRPNINSWVEIGKTPIYKNDNYLRDYQLEGVNWLRYCYYRWQNCILADEMGLGKTIQSICFILDIYNLGIKGPFLIIAPLSTIHNWYREFKNWTDLNVIVYHGTSKSRKIIHKHEVFYHDSNNNPTTDICKYEVLITTYEMILAEIDYLSKVKWRTCVVDEAHRLKNKKCKLIEGLSYVDIEHRVLLTGTPLQNSLEELYSLLHFLDPQNVGNERAFMDEFGNLHNSDQVLKLQKMLKPIMLRRIKEDVEKNLAPKEETIIEVEMTTIQKKIYLSVLERNFAFLRKGTMSSNFPNLMNTMMELRKCCNHPFLIKGCEDKIISEYSAGDTANMYLHHWTCLVESSGKMVLVDKLLPKLKSNGHRVLMFSQMVRVLDIIEQYLGYKQYSYERIDGSIRGNLRQSAIDRFSKPESDRFVFLLCTKAGGLGINLTAADTVIIFDSDWNPQNDIQAQARCHRIGQSKSVKVYRLICRASYEREMFDRASKKLGLDRAVLQNMGGDKGQAKITSSKNDKNPLSKHEVEDLLRRGAYGAIMDEDIAKSAQFCAEDIDQILERRTEVIQLAGERTGSTFAKASFASEVRNDIDLNDPDFWDKWAKKAKISLNGNQGMFESRRDRKQITYGDADGDFAEILSDNDEFSASELYEETRNRTTWLRAECFKVEKQLLIFGWGRWNDIINGGNFKNSLGCYDVENISRCIIAFCYHYGKTENTTKSYVENVIKSSFAKSEDSDYDYNSKRRQRKSLYGRRSKRLKDKTGPCAVQINSDWKIVDPNQIILHPSYKKHLIQNANKILHRIRLLHFVQHHILKGYNIDYVRTNSADALVLNVNLPIISPSLSISSWWNEDCDKSLVIGIFKHGFEKYKDILFDQLLVFQRIVPPEALKRYSEREQELTNKGSNSQNKNGDHMPRRRGRRKKSEIQFEAMKTMNNDGSDYLSWEDENIGELDDDQQNEVDLTCLSIVGNYTYSTGKSMSEDWPNNSDLNTRFRRIVTSFWKPKKLSDSNDKIKKGIILNGPNLYEIKLTRKEEADYYKALMQYGLEHTVEKNAFKEPSSTLTEQMELKKLGFINNFWFLWDKFRIIKGFDKRDDAFLSAYTLYFLASCEYLVITVNGLRPLTDSLSMYSVDMNTIPSNFKTLEGLNVDKAVKALNRIDFFEQIRNKVLLVPGIEEKITSIKLGIPGMDFPDWWETGRHDIMLLKMIAQYGLPASDKAMFLDENYDFARILRINYDSSFDHQWSPMYGSYQDFSQISYEVLIGLLKWPKQRSLIIRIKKLIHFFLFGIWSNNEIELDDKYRLPVKPALGQQLLLSGSLIDDIKPQYGMPPVKMMPLKIPEERLNPSFEIAKQYGADLGMFQEKFGRGVNRMDPQFPQKK